MKQKRRGERERERDDGNRGRHVGTQRDGGDRGFVGRWEIYMVLVVSPVPKFGLFLISKECTVIWVSTQICLFPKVCFSHSLVSMCS